MPMPETPRWDFGALLPGVGVFGGVRRYLARGNELVRRGHRYTLYHPPGEPPDWMPFQGETRPLAALGEHRHQVLVAGDASLVSTFADADAGLKIFYWVTSKLDGARRVARDKRWTIAANSTAVVRMLWRRYRVRAEPCLGGIDLDLFHPRGQPRPAQPEPFRVLVNGRLARPRKGTKLILRAVELVARQARRWPAWAGTVAHPIQIVLFDHVGVGNEQDPRPQLRTSLPYEFHLNLPQTEFAALFSTCDVLVSAERSGSWNNTVAEAMACGLPVVCSPSGTGDLARHLETAWVSRWRYPPFLARGLNALYRDPELRARLRRDARTQMGRFTWAQVADRIEAVVAARLRAN